MAVRARRVAPATYDPVTLQEARDHLRWTITDTGQDAIISSHIKAATEELENKLQRTLCETTWAATFDSFPAALKLPMAPLLSVVSVQYKDETGTLQTMATGDYMVDTVSEPGFVVPAPGVEWPATQDGAINAVTVTYKAGYKLAPGNQAEAAALVPKPLKAWILIRVGTLFENRESVSFASAPFDIQTLDRLIDTYRIREV